MRFALYMQEAIASFWAMKLRTLLTILSLLIGTASVVAMVSGGKLAAYQTLEQFKALGTDLLSVTIYQQVSETPGFDLSVESRKLDMDAVLKLKALSKEVTALAPYFNLFTSVSFQGQEIESNNIIGAHEDLAHIVKLPLQKGRFVSSFDRYSLFCVLGHDVYEKIRELDPHPMGQQIKIGPLLFTIIGVAGPAENSFIYANLNHSIFIPLEVSHLISPHADIHNIVFKLADSAASEAVSQEIKQYFKQNYPHKRLYVRSAQEYIQRMQKQQSILTVLLGLIGSISLIVGGIGVMNIMLVSVAERRREIGIRMALGARRRDIQRLFLIEATLLSVCGGVLGIALGVFISFLIASYQHWSWTFFILPPVIGFIVSALTGIIFGFYPAHRAAQLHPIETLRGE